MIARCIGGYSHQYTSLGLSSLDKPPWVYPAWDSLPFLDLVDHSLSHIREVFSYYLLKYFLESFLSLSLLLMGPFGAFNVVPEVSYAVFFFFLIFPLIFCFAAVISTILSSRSLIHSSASVVLLLTSSSVVFISVCSLVLLGLW